MLTLLPRTFGAQAPDVPSVAPFGQSLLARRASPRLRRPGADALPACVGGRRRLPVRHQLLGGLSLLDTGGGIHLVHPVRDLPALKGGELTFAG